jgi:hypothetical protein
LNLKAVLPQLQTLSISSAIGVTTYKIRIQPTDKSICAGVFPPTNERLDADEIVLRPNLPITASAPNRIVSIVMSARFPCRGFFRAIAHAVGIDLTEVDEGDRDMTDRTFNPAQYPTSKPAAHITSMTRTRPVTKLQTVDEYAELSQLSGGPP